MTTIKVFYMYHQDDLSHLTPLLLLDRGRIWQGFIKKPSVYYLFLDKTTYIKLWKDKKGNLLFMIDSVDHPIFSEGEADIFYIEVTVNYIEFSDNFIVYVNNKIEFTTPIIETVRRLNQWATRPLVHILYQLFAHDTSAQAEAHEVEEEVEEVE